MALTTASSKLRSTILFSSKEEQVFFKRSSADLAAARGLTPSALLARLPMEQLTSSDLGRWAAQLIYAEDGNCLDAFEAMFEDWSAIQETLYLLAVPGMRESIKAGMAEPLEKSSKALKW